MLPAPLWPLILHVLLKLLVHGLLPQLLHALTRLLFKLHALPRIKLTVLMMPSVLILLLPSNLVITSLINVPIKPMLIAIPAIALRLPLFVELLPPQLVLNMQPKVLVKLLMVQLLVVLGLMPPAQILAQLTILLLVLQMPNVRP